jgi:transcriptional regulator NrdR family protein
MKCPRCGGDSIVRKTENRRDQVNRFRTCKNCYTNFTTTEKLSGQTGSSKSVKSKMEQPTV